MMGLPALEGTLKITQFQSPDQAALRDFPTFSQYSFDPVAWSFPCLMSHIRGLLWWNLPLFEFPRLFVFFRELIMKKNLRHWMSKLRLTQDLVIPCLKKSKEVVTAGALPPRFAGLAQALEFPPSTENDPVSLGILSPLFLAAFRPLSPEVLAHLGSFPEGRAEQSSWRNPAVKKSLQEINPEQTSTPNFPSVGGMWEQERWKLRNK